jgi:arylsulfatase A-like enzyme
MIQKRKLETVFLKAITGFLCFLFTSSLMKGAEKEKLGKPNILFILVDDLGKEWISCYGAEKIETPNIERLAETGMRFENVYSMPQCTPTRATLLTGQYPFRNGWTNHWDVPRWGSGCHFDPQRNASFARLLRNAGYATAIAGKWQIDDFRVEPMALYEAGFDAWSVWTGGEGGNIEKSSHRYWNPYIHEGNVHGTRSRTREEYGPDIYTNFLIDFMKNNKDRPLLLYYPMCLTHGPLVTTPDEPNASGDEGRFKAMVRYMDKMVGRLMNALGEEGLRDETIIIFTTDNGTMGRQTGIRNGREVRGAKAQRRESGTAMPFIVSGPGLVPQGKVTYSLTDFTDMLPTFAELAGTIPNQRWQVDGHSIAPLLLGKTNDSPREWICSQGGHPASFQNNRVVPADLFDDRVIRNKSWKLWVNTRREPVKLYDMKNDPWEENNLIDSKRKDARAAKKELMKVIKQMPKVDAAPRYDPNPAMPWDKSDYGGILDAPNRRFHY